MKKVLVIGSGGREHAIAWKIDQNDVKIFAAPGNGGTATIAENVGIKSDDIKGLARFAEEKEIDLTIVGPELPISLGIYEEFRNRGLRILAPSKDGAQLEASKIYAKKFMRKYGIPTADFRTFGDPEEALSYVGKIKKFPVVIKADGLAAGKGVVIAESPEEARETVENFMINKKFGEASSKIVIENFLEGQEFSIFILTDGNDYRVLGGACDYKKLLEGDRGPNTGGMGSVAPVPFLDEGKLETVRTRIIEPTILGIKSEKLEYKGFLYFGLIWTNDGPMVLEYNVRLGDPETQAMLPVLEVDFLGMIENLLEGKLDEVNVPASTNRAVTVVAVSLGYPIKYTTGKEIIGLEESENTVIFHAGTKRENGKILTSGGRVLAVTGIGDSFEEAISRAYQKIGQIHFEGMYYRRDIGEKWTRKILIIAGSESDREFVSYGTEILDRLAIPYELRIISAHRNLPQLVEYLRNISGFEVIIAVAGLSAHLPGVIAGLTNLPVIGVPRDTGPLNGMDALYSMVQMPRGVPVATMAIGKHGMINGILEALRILSIKYEWALKALKNWRR